MSLVTFANLKVFLGIDPSDTAQDAIILMFQESVEASIIAFCDTDFTIKTVVNEVVDGILADVIVPRNYPITAVDAVVLGVYPDGSDGFALDATRDYAFTESAITLRGNQTPFSRSSVRIDYKWGYPSVPGDVAMAVYQSVKTEMQRYNRNTEDLASRSKGDESEGYGNGGGASGVWDSSTGLPKVIVAKLANYKTFEFPTAGMAQRNT
jgi:hypothetical protein